jgi:hypothetical protein
MDDELFPVRFSLPLSCEPAATRGVARSEDRATQPVMGWSPPDNQPDVLAALFGVAESLLAGLRNDFGQLVATKKLLPSVICPRFRASRVAQTPQNLGPQPVSFGMYPTVANDVS